jgi:hypothetical protein
MAHAPRNIAASVRQRLLNLSRSGGTDYNQLLIRYAIERLLYRLSLSSHRDAFILKGAMLFPVWEGSPHRPTQDLDLLGLGDRSLARITSVFREICTTPVEMMAGHSTPRPLRRKKFARWPSTAAFVSM